MSAFGVGTKLVTARYVCPKETKMTEVEANTKLHSLLFKEGRELVNIKFFPGTDRGLTAGQLSEGAQAALAAALAEGPINNPPMSGSECQTLEGFLAKR